MSVISLVLSALLASPPAPLVTAAWEAGQEVSGAVFSARSVPAPVQGISRGGTSWKTWAVLLAVAGGAVLWMAYGGSSGGTGCPEPPIPEFETTTGNTIVPVGAGQRDCLTYLRR